MSHAEKFGPMPRGFDLGQAVAEANRCLLCHEPPCSKGCPAQTDPGTFIRKLRMRNITGAIRTVKQNNILGGACGVLCPTSRLCEKECSACGIDRPIRIGMIQRFLVEHGRAIGFNPLAFDGSGLDARPTAAGAAVAVVGAGPAGLSCAAELSKQGCRVTIFEARPEPGGVLRYGVPAFRFESAFLAAEIDDLKALGVSFACSTPIQGQQAVEKLLAQGFKAVFISVGLWQAVRLHEPPASIPGLFTSVDFLASLREEKFVGLAPFFQDKVAAVIGGGSVAIDCARSALRLGASDVYLVYRRSYSQMTAEEDERLEALREGVHFIPLNQPVDYVTNATGGLKGIKLLRTRLGDPDASGRRRPVSIPDSEWVLPTDAAIEAIGNQADASSADAYPSVALQTGRLIRADEADCRTSLAGVFAGGDIIRGPDLVVRAVADGKTAAKSILTYLADR